MKGPEELPESHQGEAGRGQDEAQGELAPTRQGAAEQLGIDEVQEVPGQCRQNPQAPKSPEEPARNGLHVLHVPQLSLRKHLARCPGHQPLWGRAGWRRVGSTAKFKGQRQVAEVVDARAVCHVADAIDPIVQPVAGAHAIGVFRKARTHVLDAKEAFRGNHTSTAHRQKVRHRQDYQ